MADFDDNLWLATYKMGRTNLNRHGPGQPSANTAVLAAANGLRKMKLDGTPSVAEDSGPGQPIINNAGDLGTDDPQVSDETHAQDLRDLEKMLAGAEEEFVLAGERAVEIEGEGGEEAVGEGEECGAVNGSGELVLVGERGKKREQAGSATRKHRLPAPGFSRKEWGEMEGSERHRAWKAEGEKKKKRKHAWRLGA
ncbi:hypothetical protein DOTSEDRAFT_39627 [Dothistroma septosporum NZE10]|uniref:Uncharacterized protein n=1 Tax=Dothistroma septosporum (strain NZE10 / CBS 128990) TaxID=675120 RepID=M2XG88_DOTSN|nr:hypothetical protein DOTSEDRAFT_39627 [Dothistroma septosporum NZE10]